MHLPGEPLTSCRESHQEAHRATRRGRLGRAAFDRWSGSPPEEGTEAPTRRTRWNQPQTSTDAQVPPAPTAELRVRAFPLQTRAPGPGAALMVGSTLHPVALELGPGPKGDRVRWPSGDSGCGALGVNPEAGGTVCRPRNEHAHLSHRTAP